MRFLTTVGVLFAVAFGALYALATFVTPRTREMTVTIPAAKLRPPPATAEAAHPRTAGTEAAVDSATSTQ